MDVYCEQRNPTIFGGGVGNFRLHCLSHFFINFENLSAHLIANILNFFILTQFLYFGRVEANKIAKNKVEPVLWDTLYNSMLG